jgi:hypothetical protein
VDERRDRIEGLEAAVTAAREALASAADTVASSRRVQRVARRAMLDARSTADTDVVAAEAEGAT